MFLDGAAFPIGQLPEDILNQSSEEVLAGLEYFIDQRVFLLT